MRNFYNCGCYVADDVSVISRCAHHNGWVVCRTDFRVTRPRQLLLGKHLKVIHHNLYDVMEHLRRPLDLIFAYPEETLFGPQHQLTTFGFQNSRMEIFTHILRLLKPGGKAVFLIDPIDLGSLAYQARLLRFKIDHRFFPVFIKSEPLFAKEITHSKVYKLAVGLNTGPLPKLRLDNLTDFFDGLDIPDDARILDLSCIHLDEVQRARPNSKIVGICEDANRYRRFAEAAAAKSAMGTSPSSSGNRSRSGKKRRKRS